MNSISRILLKPLAIIFFVLAIASVLATLIAAPDSGGSPGLFLAIVLAGFGKWLLGKSQGKSARETFGRAVEVADTRDAGVWIVVTNNMRMLRSNRVFNDCLGL